MKVRSLQQQAEIQDEVLRIRLDSLLLPLMEAAGLDAWVIPSKEYNEDPLMMTMVPSGFPTARRITILVFTREDGQVKRWCVNRPSGELEAYYTRDWDLDNETQWEALARVLRRANPRTIGLNISDNYATCDGLSKGLYDTLASELPADLVTKFTSAEAVGVRFLETRTPREMEIWPEVMAVAMDIINEAYSRDAVVPGKTTCRELEWLLMQRTNDRGLPFWFPPTIDVQRPGGRFDGDEPIQEGDLIHCDFGIKYLGLCTDTQRLVYLLKPGETEVPTVLVAGMEENNRFQDIVEANMHVGKTGNHVLMDSLNQAKQEGIEAMLYTHPLGLHGHATGPTIGLFNQQDVVPGCGDALVYDDTGYAWELNTARLIDGWPQNKVYFFTEESVIFTGGKIVYLAAGRETIGIL